MRRHLPRVRAELGAWLRLIPLAALTCCGVGALEFVEILVRAPPHGTMSLWFLALAAASEIWLAGAVLGLIALVVWAARRCFGPPVVAAKPPPPRRVSREMRLRGWGVNIVMAWLGVSILALIVMSDTGTGLFARFATGVPGLRDVAGLATFLLGTPVFLAPLLLLAILPWQTRWPLIAGMQGVVKPVPRAHLRRRRR